jgi:hypothetical protein
MNGITRTLFVLCLMSTCAALGYFVFFAFSR